MRPYFLQPYKILPFLTRQKQIWPASVTREVYLSFEDALWDLLPRLGYRKGSKFLIPSFYCIDVIENIENHGYKTSIYEVDPHLQIDEATLVKTIAKEEPDIFVNFDPAGAPSGITEKALKKLSFKTLIIQDKVHTLVGGSMENYPLSDRHLILTSHRKVTPFPGALAIYTRSATTPQSKLPLKYTLQALLLWTISISALKLAKFFHSVALVRYAENIIEKHNDHIGDALTSAPLPKLLLHLYDHIAVNYVQSVKEKQFPIYDSALKPFFISHKRDAWTLPNLGDYAKDLRGYPVIVKTRSAKKFMELCRKEGFITDTELGVFIWYKDHKIFYLPLGPHLSEQDIKKIAEITLKALTGAIQYDTITA